jgi:hypothetical protein
MTANRLEFQDDGVSIWITIPPKIGSDGSDNVLQEETNASKVVSLDNLYSAAADRKQEKGKDLSASKLPFLWKLYEMLEDVESTSQDDIVSWVNGGEAFKVHQLQTFVETIIPKYSKISKYKSFQRQLYLYGFTRIQSGTHKGAYHHPKFVRGMKTLCLSVTPKNSSRQRSSSNSNSEASTSSSTLLESAKQARMALERSESAPAKSNIGQAAAQMERPQSAPYTTSRGAVLGFPLSATITANRSELQNSNRSFVDELRDGSIDYVFGGMPFHCLPQDNIM